MADYGDQGILTFPVHLNVYDLDNITFNRFLRLIGLGFYHTCVQVHGREYMFSNGDGEESGIVSGQQNQLPWCEGLHMRATILIGQTSLDANLVGFTMQAFANYYPRNSYDIFTSNCNHFSNLLCWLLTGNKIPPWVNRVAAFGAYLWWILPVTKVKAEVRRIALRMGDEDGDGDGDGEDNEHDGGDDDDGGGDEHDVGGSGDGVGSGGDEDNDFDDDDSFTDHWPEWMPSTVMPR